MIPKGVHPYYEPCYEGFKDAGSKLGVKTEYLAAKAFEVPQEVEIIENVIARRVDGIAISALDDQGLPKDCDKIDSERIGAVMDDTQG